MNATSNANNTVSTIAYINPEVFVTMSNIQLDLNKCKFSLDLSTSVNGTDWSEPENIQGSIVLEVKDWLTKMTDDKVKVVADNEKGFEWVPTGKRSTNFQRYLRIIGMESLVNSKDVLSNLVFSCHNSSEDRAANPFRLTQRLSGHNTLTFVNLPSRKVIESIDEKTGEIHKHYVKRIGKFATGEVVRAFVKPSDYKRYSLQVEQIREVYQDPAE